MLLEWRNDLEAAVIIACRLVISSFWFAECLTQPGQTVMRDCHWLANSMMQRWGGLFGEST